MIMVILAIIPGIILFFVVWKLDTVEKESPALLAKLFFGGALTIISAQLLGLGGEKLLRLAVPDVQSIWYIFLFSFLLIGLVEEAGKFLVLRLITWKDKEFNYTFDGVVYAVVVSLGFAVVENIIYVILHGSDVNLVRVLLSVPGHMVYAVFMGFFYGQARYAKGDGDSRASIGHTLAAIMVPTVMHGFYSFCIGTGSKVFFIMFIVYEVIMALIAVLQFIRLSKNDTLIPGMEYTVKGEDE